MAAGLFFCYRPTRQKQFVESHRKIDSHSKDYKTYNSDNLSFVVTFYSGNRVEWILSDLACSSNSITSTALYDTLGHDASKYILKSTESPVIISSKEHIRGLIDLKKEDAQGLASIILIVSMEPLTQKDQHLVDFAESNNIKLYDFSQVERTGAIFLTKSAHQIARQFYNHLHLRYHWCKPQGSSFYHKDVVLQQ